MINEGALEGIQEIYALRNTHIGQEATVNLKEGLMLAGASDVDIIIVSDTQSAMTAVSHLMV